jgi:hypothetical protein
MCISVGIFLSCIDKKHVEITGYIPENEFSTFVGYFRKLSGDKTASSSNVINEL